MLKIPVSSSGGGGGIFGNSYQHHQYYQQPLYQHHFSGSSAPAAAPPAPPKGADHYHHAEPLFPVRWRSLVDNVVVELLASMFVNLATILCWTSSTSDSLQFVPSVVLGLVFMCIKDEDYFFPDGSPTVTFVLWVLGGYTWIHMAARVVGQALGFGLSLWICMMAVVPPLNMRVEQGLSCMFALELIGTALEHMAIVYVILPLLPPASSSPTTNPTTNSSNSNNNNQSGLRMLRKVKPKSHHESQAPPNPMVMHASLVFAGLHWCLSKGLCIEMSPMVTLLVAILRSNAGHHENAWSLAIVAIWAQFVGVGLCVAYVSLFAPRETKYWPLSRS